MVAAAAAASGGSFCDDSLSVPRKGAQKKKLLKVLNKWEKTWKWSERKTGPLQPTIAVMDGIYRIYGTRRGITHVN